MRAARQCPSCKSSAKVTKSITTVNNDERAEKLQTIRCDGCGLTGFVTVISSVTWKFPVKSSTGQ